MPRNFKHPTKSDIRDFKRAMEGKSPYQQRKILAANYKLQRTASKVRALGATGRNRGTSCTPDSIVIDKIVTGKYKGPAPRT